MHGPMQDSLSPAGVELVWQVASLTGTKHGLQIDNETLRVAMGLRLGTSLGQPNECSHWNLRMTYSAYRVSAVGGVKGDVHSMLLRVAYFTYFWLQATYTVNCIDLMERDLTATSSYVRTMELHRTPGVGCDVPRHPCTLACLSCHNRDRWCGCSGEQLKMAVRLPGHVSLVQPVQHGDVKSV